MKVTYKEIDGKTFKTIDDEIEAIQARAVKGFKLVAAFWIGSFVVSLGLLGALGYVACHFLAKVW